MTEATATIFRGPEVNAALAAWGAKPSQGNWSAVLDAARLATGSLYFVNGTDLYLSCGAPFSESRRDHCFPGDPDGRVYHVWFRKGRRYNRAQRRFNTTVVKLYADDPNSAAE